MMGGKRDTSNCYNIKTYSGDVLQTGRSKQNVESPMWQ